MPLRLNGSTSGYSEIDAPAVAGDQTFTLPSTGGTLDRLNRAGNILQVVQATYATPTTNSTSTYADTGLTAAITPSSASSKILIYVTQAGVNKAAGNAGSGCTLRLLRDATEIIQFATAAGFTNTSLDLEVGNVCTYYLDSPNTTSSTTYKTQFKNAANASSVRVQGNNTTSTITLLEVAA